MKKANTAIFCQKRLSDEIMPAMITKHEQDELRHILGLYKYRFTKPCVRIDTLDRLFNIPTRIY